MNRRVFRDAESRALLCNVVDVPELCSFILPAVHRHEPIAVAVSTGGASPALAQHLRDQIATVVRPEHAELAHRLRELRPWAKSHFATYEERKAYFAGLVAEELGRVTVHLVGAGPGDPGLITARGLELVRACDVLVADVLVAQELIDEAPEDAIVISRAGMKQEAVTRLLVAYGTTGLDTVRLKGGDPFVFGRGGEEALALAEAGIPFEIVPGVSSIAAVPASALIPVTHRGVSDRVTIASGHGADGGEPDYASLAAAGGTLVLFMGLERVEQLCRGLVAAGLPSDDAGSGRLARHAARPGIRLGDARDPGRAGGRARVAGARDRRRRGRRRREPRGCDGCSLRRARRRSLQGHTLEGATLTAVGPGAYTLSIATAEGRLTVKLDRQGARITSVEV